MCTWSSLLTRITLRLLLVVLSALTILCEGKDHLQWKTGPPNFARL